MKPAVRGRIWTIVAFLVILSVVVAACGGAQEAPTPETAPAVATAPGIAPETPAVEEEPTAEEVAETPAADAEETPAADAEETPAAEAEETPAAEAEATPAEGAGAEMAEAAGQLNPDVSGTIEFWHFWGSPLRRTAIRRVIAECQAKLPNITVNEVFKPFGDIWTANIAAVAAGSGMPDVIVADRPTLPRDAADGIYQSLEEMAERDQVDPGIFWPFTWEQTIYEGETYGLPYETDVRVLFYNRNAFEEVGLDPENPPQTWEELWAAADMLDIQNEDGSYERIAFFPLWGNVGPDVWALTNGHQWVSEDGQEVNINDPRVVETLNWIQQWVDRYGGWDAVQEFGAQFGAPPNDRFMSGKVAMIVDVNGYNGVLNFFRPRVPSAEDPSQMVDLDWGVSDIPYNVDRASASGGFALSIPTGAQNVDAAWEFIKCASGPEGQLSWARDTNSMPTVESAARDPVLMADPRWQFFVDAMEYSTANPFVPNYPNWLETLSSRYDRIWTGELTPEQAVQEAQQEVDAELQ